MRRILIVGAGQAGLQLALSLQSAGYDVTVMSARTPEEIRAGRIMSTQCMFWPQLQLERDHGLNLWEHEAPDIVAQRVTVAAPPGTAAFQTLGRWDQYAQSIDQRVKMAGWLELFEERGGNAVYHSVMTSDLEGLSALYDLTIIAAGKGELVELFDRDVSRSPYDRPQRHLSCIYLHGMTPWPGHPEPHVRITATPGVGELFFMPGYTLTGPCDILLWEAVPGGPFDCWSDRPDPAGHLDRTLDLLRQYVPWEHERVVGAEPTDARSTLYGGYAPVVRHPVGRLSASASVLGMADVVVANDPVTGQGSNNAARCAEVYLREILGHGDRPFDDAWMQRTFDAYWDYARHPTAYTNMMLGPLPDHVQKVLATAAQNETVAHRFAHGYANPADFENWLMDPERAEAYLASVTTG
ncbi:MULTISPECIES: styrene monooxygenase/indole monooxygenase family protein [Thermomonosporaceae]|uniref:styrene monooxygenase/indole monooxygenase family protein n=1 Tax=Thermomonosporaceae TaxID=2012 RepID=UPI00255AFF49|nr:MULTISPECIES: styrene monooxygenase/indole monooxygenase family protein [Thermomonosporaceae]MDL4776868.1 FAD-binding oxidoreductase [Actinomadura xylanilytica]